MELSKRQPFYSRPYNGCVFDYPELTDEDFSQVLAYAADERSD